MSLPMAVSSKTIVYDQPELVRKWVGERTNSNFMYGQAIGLMKDGELIAGVVYDNAIGNTSIAMHVAATGKQWLTREFLNFVFGYPFLQLGVHKVLGLVSSANEQALKFDTHLGFREEGRIKDATPGGDLVILTMTRDQCKFIEGKYRERGIEYWKQQQRNA